ncbi:MAG TPA: SdpI family protein [Cryomorphaceae bacterium]|nr:SdpI family protein [Cryomorphaceae bacterium]
MDSIDPLLLIPLLVCPLFIIAGLILVYTPPKKINYLYGYRSKRSMRNQETWDYAQPRAGKRLIYLGLAYLCTSLIDVVVPNISDWSGAAMSLGLLLIGVFVLFRKMENDLKERFGQS